MGERAEDVVPRRVVITNGAAGREHVRDRAGHSGLDEDGDIARLRESIASTRADMSATIDEIQLRVTPERVKARAKAEVREATIGRVEHMFGRNRSGASSGIIETIRENPIPSAMVAIGLGMLFRNRAAGDASFDGRRYSDRSSRGSYDESFWDRYDYDRFGTGDRNEAGDQGLRGRVAGAASQAQGKVADVAAHAQDKASEMAERAQDKASELREDARERAAELRFQAGYRAQQAQGGFDQMMRENPLALGAMALAAGAAVGLMAPSTDREDRMFGEARDSLVDRAQTTAQEAMGKAQAVAEKAAAAAKDEAGNQGLPGGDRK